MVKCKFGQMSSTRIYDKVLGDEIQFEFFWNFTSLRKWSKSVRIQFPIPLRQNEFTWTIDTFACKENDVMRGFTAILFAKVKWTCLQLDLSHVSLNKVTFFHPFKKNQILIPELSCLSTRSLKSPKPKCVCNAHVLNRKFQCASELLSLVVPGCFQNYILIVTKCYIHILCGNFVKWLLPC